MKKKPLVCIAMVNWNGGQVALDCLSSFFKKTIYPNFKVVMIDNNSTDNSIQDISKLKFDIDIIRNKENVGYAPAINACWRYCLDKYNPDYICNLSIDIITLQDNWLDLMVEELEKDELRGICSNKLVWADGRVQLLFYDRHPKDYNEIDHGQYDFVKEVTAVGGATMIVKRSVIEKIGGSDEHFFYGPDDVDYCFRAGKAGFKIVYQGFSKSEHIGSFSYLSSKKDFIYKHQSYGQMIFQFRHFKLKGKLLMPLKQLIRAFVTRKRPFQKWTFDNIYFHKTFLKRIFIFFGSWIKAARDYKTVKLDYFNLR